MYISEVHPDFVESIHAYLTEGQGAQVKVLQINDDGRIDPSIKRAEEDWDEESRQRRSSSRVDKDFTQQLGKFTHRSDTIQGEVRRRKRSRQWPTGRARLPAAPGAGRRPTSLVGMGGRRLSTSTALSERRGARGRPGRHLAGGKARACARSPRPRRSRWCPWPTGH